MTRSELEAIVVNVKYRDWTFRVFEKGDGYLVQPVFTAPDIHTGSPTKQYCRKWWVSSHAVKSEVVRTLWKAVEAAVIHEAAEEFQYKGYPIQNPHHDVDEFIGLGEEAR